MSMRRMPVGLCLALILGISGVAGANVHDCRSCHQVHGNGSFVPVADETLCLACHGPGGIATRAESHRTSEDSEYRRWRSDCFDCHDPHEDPLPNRFGRTNLSFVGNDLFDSSVASIRFRTEEVPAGDLLPVVFESRGTGAGGAATYSFADADQDRDGEFDGICEVCHTRTRYHRFDGSGEGGHHVGETCTNRCHQHAKGFIRKK